MGDQASTSTSTQPVQQDTRTESTDRPGQHNTQASSLGYDQIDDGEVGNILILHIRSLVGYTNTRCYTIYFV